MKLSECHSEPMTEVNPDPDSVEIIVSTFISELQFLPHYNRGSSFLFSFCSLRENRLIKRVEGDNQRS